MPLIGMPGKKHAKLLLWGLSVLFAFVGSQTVHAATYYVATNGNDSVPCVTATNTTTPKRTINNALSCLVPGDTVYIRAGTYPESISSNRGTIPVGTSWNAPVTIAGYPGETVTLKPVGVCEVLALPAAYLQYIIFKDMILDGSDLIESAEVSCVGIGLQPMTHHLRFQNLEVKNNPWSGILGGGSYHEFINLKVHDNGAWTQIAGYAPGANGAYLTTNNSVIDGGEYFNNLCYGVRFYNSSASSKADNNVLKNAKLYRNGRGVAFNGTAQCGSMGGGVVLGDNNNSAYNNLIYSNYWGLTTSTEKSTVALIFNNTFYNNKYGIDISSQSVNTQVRNNILSENGFGIQNYGSNTVFSTNLCSTSGLGCTLIGDPKFANPAGLDLRPQTGSPAIDAGTQVTAVRDDFARILRPQGTRYDIGAYETNGTDGTAPSPPTNVRLH